MALAYLAYRPSMTLFPYFDLYEMMKLLPECAHAGQMTRTAPQPVRGPSDGRCESPPSQRQFQYFAG